MQSDVWDRPIERFRFGDTDQGIVWLWSEGIMLPDQPAQMQIREKKAKCKSRDEDLRCD